MKEAVVTRSPSLVLGLRTLDALVAHAARRRLA